MPTTHRIPVADGAAVDAVHHEAASTPGSERGTGPPSRTHDGPVARPWIVFCHGLRSDKTGSYERRCDRAVEEGYDAVRFDCRGCGESDGEFVDATLGSRLEDLGSVVEYFDIDAYVPFGSSFGGAVALHRAASDDRVEAVIARAPVTYTGTFDGYRETIEREGVHRFDDGTRIDRRFVEDLDRYPFAAIADEIDVPVAIFHGARDESVPLGASLDAVGALETEVLLERFQDEGHLFSEGAEKRLLRRAFDWLRTV